MNIRKRKNRPATDDFCEDTEPAVTSLVPTDQPRALTPGTGIRSLPRAVVAKWKASLPVWFDTARPMPSSASRSFPLSAFAALVAVAVSLLLIVASSVLVTRSQWELGKLNKEIDAVSVEVEDLRSDLEVRDDLLEIRTLATGELGMIEEQYVRMQYISLGREDRINAYEEETAESVGLSTLLSAIGIK